MSNEDFLSKYDIFSQEKFPFELDSKFPKTMEEDMSHYKNVIKHFNISGVCMLRNSAPKIIINVFLLFYQKI